MREAVKGAPRARHEAPGEAEGREAVALREGQDWNPLSEETVYASKKGDRTEIHLRSTIPNS